MYFFLIMILALLSIALNSSSNSCRLVEEIESADDVSLWDAILGCFGSGFALWDEEDGVDCIEHRPG